jgi:hypothetical protein
VNGAIGIALAQCGRLLFVLGVTITRGTTVERDAIANPEDRCQRACPSWTTDDASDAWVIRLFHTAGP